MLRAAPTQSAILNNENVAPPANLLFSDTPATIGQKRLDGRTYERNVKSKRNTTNTATLDDMQEASDYLIAVEVASMLPNIAAHANTTNNLQITTALANITTTLATINNKLDRMEDVSYNHSAHADEDDLKPPKNSTNGAHGLRIPRTVRELRELSGIDLSATETYYGLGHTGTTEARVKAIRRIYGVGLMTQTGYCASLNSYVRQDTT